MKAAGIALAVAGLFPICVDGFSLINDCLTAPKFAQDGDGIESSYSRGLVYSMNALLFLLTPSLGLYKWVVLYRLCFRYFCLKSLLEAWGVMWELDKDAEKDSKLNQYLRSGPNTGRQVLTTLCYFIHFRECKIVRRTPRLESQVEACSMVSFRSRCSIQCPQIQKRFKNLEVDQILISQDLTEPIRKRGAHMKVLKRCRIRYQRQQET